MTRDLAASWRAWRSFRGSGPAARAFLVARSLNLPLGDLDRDLRSLSGRVLSVGCGHGLLERYLAELNPRVDRVDGFELDGRRVAAAERSRAAAPRVHVARQDVTSLDPEEGVLYDAALAVDVLHHVPYGTHTALAQALHSALRPGGVLLVKDISTEPAWQHRFNAVMDRLVSGEVDVQTRHPEDMAALFRASGFDVLGCRSVGRRSPYPHYLLTLQRPADRV